MGGLWIETPAGEQYPVSWYGLSDTKLLLELLVDQPLLPVCARVFGLNLQPLQKIETDWMNVDLGEAIWQEPHILIDCANTLATALATTPDVSMRLEDERQQQGLTFLNYTSFEDEDFPFDLLVAELTAIAKTVQEAQQKGALRVKLTGA